MNVISINFTDIIVKRDHYLIKNYSDYSIENSKLIILAITNIGVHIVKET